MRRMLSFSIFCALLCGATLVAQTKDRNTAPSTGNVQNSEATAPTQGAAAPAQKPASSLPNSDQPSTPAQEQENAITAHTDQDTVRGTLIQHERDSWANSKAKDAAYFTALPDSFKADLANGKTENKSEITRNVAARGLLDYNLSNFNVTFSGEDRADVTYTASYSGKRDNGSTFEQTRQVISHWQRNTDGTWQNLRVDFQ